MRSGTSKGPYLMADNLPQDSAERDQLLLKIMGSPHAMQIDGLGGAQPQTSKVAIVSKSTRNDADIDYLFAQVLVDKAIVDTNPNCGNMLIGIAPFAIEEGLFAANGDTTVVRIHNVNTNTIVHSTVETPNGKVNYTGDCAIDGVPGSSAPIELNFFNAEGAKTGQFFPTGQTVELIDGIEVTLVDYSVPMMLVEAANIGIDGSETVEQINQNQTLLGRLEELRVEAGKRMGLGDVRDKVIPKVAILSPARKDGVLTSRYLMPHSCHKSHAISGAMCLASCCYVENTVVAKLIGRVLTEDQQVVIEHPSGVIELQVLLGKDSRQIHSMVVSRTARRLFEGHVLI